MTGGWPRPSWEAGRAIRPSLRGAILDTLLGRPSWTSALLSSLEDTCVPPGEIPPAIRRRLLEQPDPNLKARALAIFERSTSSTRREVLDAYRPSIASPGRLEGRGG